jgi:hypothetical protein
MKAFLGHNEPVIKIVVNFDLFLIENSIGVHAEMCMILIFTVGKKEKRGKRTY